MPNPYRQLAADLSKELRETRAPAGLAAYGTERALSHLAQKHGFTYEKVRDIERALIPAARASPLPLLELTEQALRLSNDTGKHVAATVEEIANRWATGTMYLEAADDAEEQNGY